MSTLECIESNFQFLIMVNFLNSLVWFMKHYSQCMVCLDDLISLESFWVLVVCFFYTLCFEASASTVDGCHTSGLYFKAQVTTLKMLQPDLRKYGQILFQFVLFPMMSCCGFDALIKIMPKNWQNNTWNSEYRKIIHIYIYIKNNRDTQHYLGKNTFRYNMGKYMIINIILNMQ